jgi:hypothetical protein
MIDWCRVASLRDEIGPDDLNEIVAIFLEEVQTEIQSLNRHVSPEDWAGKLHFIKGSALNLGFADLAELCGPDAGFDDLRIAEAFAASRAAFLSRLNLPLAA